VSISGYEVKLWEPRRIGGTAKGRWRVRWQVAGREHCRSFPVRVLADQFAGELRAAAREGRRFDEITGLPAAQPAGVTGRSWYAHARWYARLKWPRLVGTSRRSGQAGRPPPGSRHDPGRAAAHRPGAGRTARPPHSDRRPVRRTRRRRDLDSAGPSPGRPARPPRPGNPRQPARHEQRSARLGPAPAGREHHLDVTTESPVRCGVSAKHRPA
jgi:hypothetical protein